MEPKAAIVWYIVFLFSVIFHEAAHAWAAKKGGDLTAYLGGQVSLDPIPHIKREPFGMVILPIISLFLIGFPFGFASAPYDVDWANRNHKKAAWMALAGPAANLILFFIALILIKVGLSLDYFEIPREIRYFHLVDPVGDNQVIRNVSMFFSIFYSMNLLLAILNMFPLPPFDGSQMISFLLSQSQARRYREFITQPIFGIIGMIIVWKLFGPVFDMSFNLLLFVLYL
jgi:Zn-dependent protease